MALREAVAPELPYLRRYARAVTGSQALGDSAVREVLEALIEAPEEFDISKPPRLELYRIFHRLWHPVFDRTLGVESPILAISGRSRQALLLAAVEGFSIADTCTILNAESESIRSDLDHARSTIAENLRSNVLIIEDETIIAMHIHSIVGAANHAVVGVARTHLEAVNLARQTHPDLVLADINLEDGSSGIAAVREILEFIDVPVIFVTAFPERLLTGERPEPTYLLTKPFEPVMLTATIAQALLIHRESAASDKQAFA